MNRKWLTGLALASVAGTGGVAYVAVAAPDSGATAAAQAPALLPLTSPTMAATTSTAEVTTTTAEVTTPTGASPVRTFSYQVGDAGTVTVDVRGTALAGRQLDPAVGWSVLGMSSTGTHLDVQLTDSHRVVGFAADLVGPDVVVSVTNSVVTGSTATATAGPPTAPVADAVAVVAKTLPATPPAPPRTVPPTTGAAPATGTTPSVRPTPSAAATTATSSAGTRNGDDGVEHDGDHGDHEDRASEYESGHDD